MPRPATAVASASCGTPSPSAAHRTSSPSPAPLCHILRRHRREPPISEDQLQSELNLAGAGGGRGGEGTDHSRDQLSLRRSVKYPAGGGRGRLEVRVIYDIEALGAELQFGSFANPEILGDGNVRFSDPRPNQSVSSQVAERAQGLWDKCAWIEIQRRRAYWRTLGDAGASPRNAAGGISAGSGRQIRTVRKARSG